MFKNSIVESLFLEEFLWDWFPSSFEKRFLDDGMRVVIGVQPSPGVVVGWMGGRVGRVVGWGCVFGCVVIGVRLKFLF